MDIFTLDLKHVRTAYIIVAGLFALCAIVSAYLHHIYVATAFIVLASATIFCGGMLISFLFRIRKEKGAD